MKNEKTRGDSQSAATDILSVILLAVIAALCGVSAVFFFYRAGGVMSENAPLFSVLFCLVVAAIAVFGSVFLFLGKTVIYRLALVSLILVFFTLLVLCLITVTGVKDKISSIEELRDFVSSFGVNAVLVTIVFEILQVVILPVPGFVAIGASVALFGAFKGSVIALAGILAGSFIAFFIGRVFGYKTASWLVGEKSLKKALETVKGKDRVVLTVMFVFPFFPDDVLCFVAGLSTMSTAYFSVMIALARAAAVFGTAYSINGSIIPYDTWWGILLWALVFALVGVVSYLIYKKGDAIERFFTQKFKKVKKKQGEVD